MCVMDVNMLELAEEMDDVLAEREDEKKAVRRKTDKTVARSAHQDKPGVVGRFSKERKLKAQARTPGYEMEVGVL